MNTALETFHPLNLSNFPTGSGKLFFEPVFDEHGKLKDLKRYSGGKPHLANQPVSEYLSDWFRYTSEELPEALWQSLEKGINCSLLFTEAPGRSVQVRVTPLDEGYLIDYKNLAPSEALAIYNEHASAGNRHSSVRPLSIEEPYLGLASTAGKTMQAIPGTDIGPQSIVSPVGQTVHTPYQGGISQWPAGDIPVASELRYRSLVNRLDMVVFQVDMSGRWTYLNQAWENITGFTVAETLGTSMQDSIISEDRVTNQLVFDEIRTGQPLFTRHEIRCHYKAGGFRWLSVSAQTVQDEYQNLVGITGLLTDITDQKLAEEAVLESAHRFRDIAENVDELFWVRDGIDNRFLYINPAYETFTGLSLEHLNNDPLSFLNLIDEADRPRVLEAVQKNDWYSTLQYKIRHANGSIRWLSARGFEAKDESGCIVRRIGVATDITNLIEKEQLLQDSLRNEQNLNALKSQFIATASHEFRTPLAAINSSVELLTFYIDREADSPLMSLLNKHLDAIASKVTSLDQLISDTLAISRLEEGKLQVNLEETNIITLAEELLTSTFSDRQDKRWVILNAPNEPVIASVDKKLLGYVLTNLLSNAFKFSTQNPRLHIYATPDSVFLEVIDEGIGIPEADLPHLFGKFFRACNASPFKGTGLGLVICQEYISLQNGRIEVKSQEGVGSTFTLILPFIAVNN